MVLCIKLFNLNGNNEPLFLSSMMVYTFISILFPYSSIHLQGGYEEAQLHTCIKFMPEIPPNPGLQGSVWIDKI